jgi:hypothetical protein
MPPKHISKIQKIWKKVRNKFSTEVTTGKLHLFYRISDASYAKEKPDYISKNGCLENCFRVFEGYQFNLIADKVMDSTWTRLEERFPDIQMERTSYGNGAASFNHALNQALGYPPDDVIYFVEDDYLHKNESSSVLIEGIKLGSDYVTLYDHPDKYMDTDNPFVDQDGEVTKVFLSRSCHWKMTSSTTMTFAAKVQTLLDDEKVIRNWTKNAHPDDFNMFADLSDCGRSLISPIPGYATHGQSEFLAPLINWEYVAKQSKSG